VYYCSVECQHENWKDHKVTCGKKLLSESELNKFINDEAYKVSRLDFSDREGKNISRLKKFLLFAEYQFGDQVPGECFRRREDGATFKNDWILFFIRSDLIRCYIEQDTVASSQIALDCATENRIQLEMRRSNTEDREMFFDNIYRVNNQLGKILIHMMRYDEALYHNQEALKAARIGYELNSRNETILFEALKGMAQINRILRNGKTAAEYAEEAYLFMSGQHGPEHSDVQKAGTCLIDSYLETENFADAERFARINYECLIDLKNNTDRKWVATGKSQLARVWLSTPPDQRIGGPEAALEAETLAREACDIYESLPRGEGFDNPFTMCLSLSYANLTKVIIARGKTGSEVERTIRKTLSFSRDCRVGVVPRLESSFNRYDFLDFVATYYHNLGYDATTGLCDIGYLERAKGPSEESVIIAKALFDSADARVLDCISRLKHVLSVIHSSGA
jgi:hypothetical protein